MFLHPAMISQTVIGSKSISKQPPIAREAEDLAPLVRLCSPMVAKLETATREWNSEQMRSMVRKSKFTKLGMAGAKQKSQSGRLPTEPISERCNSLSMFEMHLVAMTLIQSNWCCTHQTKHLRSLRRNSETANSSWTTMDLWVISRSRMIQVLSTENIRFDC